jgi:hypothetical protein
VFDIQLIGSPQGEGERFFNWGRLTLGGFIEEFEAPLVDWAPGDYAAQWLEAAHRLTKGAPVAVFLTHMMHPEAAYHVGWPAWREGDRVFIQERLFVRERLSGPFDPEYPELHAGERRAISIEGLPISQWEVGMPDVAAFLERRGRSAPVG